METANDKSGFKIESGIPIPDSNKQSGVGIHAALRSLEVSQSFFIAGRKIDKVSNHVNYAKKTLRRNFTCRSMDGGVRVWRTE